MERNFGIPPEGFTNGNPSVLVIFVIPRIPLEGAFKYALHRMFLCFCVWREATFKPLQVENAVVPSGGYTAQ